RAGPNLEQGVPLFRRSFFIYEKTDGAVALVNCFWPLRGEAEAEAVEREVVIVSAFDQPDPNSMTEARGRRRRKFARATVVAVTGLQIISIEKPFFHGEIPPRFRTGPGGLSVRSYKANAGIVNFLDQNPVVRQDAIAAPQHPKKNMMTDLRFA